MLAQRGKRGLQSRHSKPHQELTDENTIKTKGHAAIIERHSLLAYTFPSFEIARARVARATEGAAPNDPAKLVGLKKPVVGLLK
jgi:hypothetical protein